MIKNQNKFWLEISFYITKLILRYKIKTMITFVQQDTQLLFKVVIKECYLISYSSELNQIPLEILHQMAFKLSCALCSKYNLSKMQKKSCF